MLEDFLITKNNKFLIFLTRNSFYLNVYLNNDIKQIIQNNEENNLDPFVRIELNEKPLKINIFRNIFILIFNEKIEIINYDNFIKNLENYYNIYSQNNQKLNIKLEVNETIKIKPDLNFYLNNDNFVQFKDKKIYITNILSNEIKKIKEENCVFDIVINDEEMFILLENNKIVKKNIKNLNLISELEINNSKKSKIYFNKNFIFLVNNNMMEIFETLNFKKIHNLEIKNKIKFLKFENEEIILINKNSEIIRYDYLFNKIINYKSDLIELTNYKNLKIDNTGIYNNCYIVSNIQGLCEIRNGNILKQIIYNI